MGDDDILNLINSLAIPIPEKDRLVLRLKEKGGTKELFLEIREALMDIENGLAKRYQHQIDELDKILLAAANELEEVDREFQKEIKEVENT